MPASLVVILENASVLLAAPGMIVPFFFHTYVKGPVPDTTGVSASGSQSHFVTFVMPPIVTNDLTTSAAELLTLLQGLCTRTLYAAESADVRLLRASEEFVRPTISTP